MKVLNCLFVSALMVSALASKDDTTDSDVESNVTTKYRDPTTTTTPTPTPGPPTPPTSTRRISHDVDDDSNDKSDSPPAISPGDSNTRPSPVVNPSAPPAAGGSGGGGSGSARSTVPAPGDKPITSYSNPDVIRRSTLPDGHSNNDVTQSPIQPSTTELLAAADSADRTHRLTTIGIAVGCSVALFLLLVAILALSYIARRRLRSNNSHKTLQQQLSSVSSSSNSFLVTPSGEYEEIADPPPPHPPVSPVSPGTSPPPVTPRPLLTLRGVNPQTSASVDVANFGFSSRDLQHTDNISGNATLSASNHQYLTLVYSAAGQNAYDKSYGRNTVI